MSQQAPVRVGDVIDGKYQVTRILGAGGMGVVVAAQHLHLAQPVALKFLLESLLQRPDLVERFLREARNCVSINSEHVVRVMDVGRLPSGAPFMVMEFLQGQDLEAEVQLDGALVPGRAVDYALQACVGLAEAHVRRLIHRDLKPANLFLTTRSDGYKLLKILDFGISKSLAGGADHALTQTNQSMGTPYYMSPEQIRAAADVDGRTDIWSLGAILYEIMAGAPPFSANTAAAVCAAVLESSPPPLTSLRPDVPPGLWEVIAWCLRKRPEDRPANVAELAAALAPYAQVERNTHQRVARILGYEAPPSSAAPHSNVANMYAAGSAPNRSASGGVARLSSSQPTVAADPARSWPAPVPAAPSPGLRTDAPFSLTDHTRPPPSRGGAVKWFAIAGASLAFLGALAFAMTRLGREEPSGPQLSATQEVPSHPTPTKPRALAAAVEPAPVAAASARPAQGAETTPVTAAPTTIAPPAQNAPATPTSSATPVSDTRRSRPKHRIQRQKPPAPQPKDPPQQSPSYRSTPEPASPSQTTPPRPAAQPVAQPDPLDGL